MGKKAQQRRSVTIMGSESELTEKAYIDIYYSAIIPSVWIGIVIIGRVFIGISAGFQDALFDFIDQEAVTCHEQTLINNGWTFAEMNKFTEDTDAGLCLKRDYNYSEFANMTYEEAMKKKEEMPKPEFVHCKHAIFDASNHIITVQADERTLCNSHNAVWSIHVIRSTSTLVAGIIFGVLSDMFGRRITSTICCLCWWIASFFLAISASPLAIRALLFICYLFATGAFIATYVNVVELLTPDLRYLVVFTDTSLSLGDCLYLYLQRFAYSWRNLVWVNVVWLLPCIFYCWYVIESPRWLINKRKKRTACTVLAQLQELVRTTDATDARERKWFTFRNMIWFHIRWKRLKIFISVLVLTLSISFLYCYTTFRIANKLSHSYSYRLASDIVIISSYIYLIPLYAFFGKQIGLIILTLLYGLLAIMDILLSSVYDKMESFFYAMGSLIDESAMALLALYIMEFYPTFVRATNFGILCGMIGISRIIFIYLGGFLAKGVRGAGLNLWYVMDGISLVLSLSAWLTLVLPQSHRVELPNYKLFQIM